MKWKSFKPVSKCSGYIDLSNGNAFKNAAGDFVWHLNIAFRKDEKQP
jgi:hypothetical protein